MRLALTGRQVDITPDIHRLVEKKLARLVRVLGSRAVSGQVELRLERFRHVAEVHVHARGGHMLKGRAVATSWDEAVSTAVDHLVQQAQTLKGKWQERKRVGPAARADHRRALDPDRQGAAHRAGAPLPGEVHDARRGGAGHRRRARTRSSSSATPAPTPSASCSGGRTATSGSSSRSRDRGTGRVPPPMTPSSPRVTVGSLLRVPSEALDLTLEVLAGAEGLERPITSPYVLKTGLALAGFDAYLQEGRVLVFGASELGYLAGLAPAVRSERLARTFSRQVPCVLVTIGLDVLPEIRDRGRSAPGVPLLRTPLATPIAIAKLTSFLEDILAERTIIHAVLMDILGLGVLIVGESGIGKSECALDLVMRGHRLVADDAVEIRRRAESVLIGTCPELTRYHMEIRGLGIINVRDLFGVASTRASKRVELVVQLERWEAGPRVRASGPRRPVLRRSWGCACR